MSCAHTESHRGMEEGLWLELYQGICKPLAKWRVDDELFEARKGVLAFVRGLRFQAQLIYGIRQLLQGTSLEASWGTILSADGHHPSPECDIIIHENCWAYQWDGDKCPVMDFRFVRRQHAKLVISCKPRVYSVGQKLRTERERVQEYVDHVWLFAECCNPASARRLEDQAAQAGYERFWHLYGMRGKRGQGVQVDNEHGWLKFVRELRALAT